MVERRVEHGGRGRPRHSYRASVEAHKRLGQNYADLAVVLWDEMMRTVEEHALGSGTGQGPYVFGVTGEVGELSGERR